MGMVRSFYKYYNTNLHLPTPVFILLILSLLYKNMLASFSAQKSMTALSKAINYTGSSVQKSNLGYTWLLFMPRASSLSCPEERDLPQRNYSNTVDRSRSQFCPLSPPASNK